MRKLGDAHGLHRNNDGTAAGTTPDTDTMSAGLPPFHAAEAECGQMTGQAGTSTPKQVETGRGTGTGSSGQ